MKKYIYILQFVLPIYLICQEYNYLDFYLEDERLIKDNQIEQFKTEDYSNLFSNNYFSLGFIGEKYQRIRIKFISVIPEFNNPLKLYVYGKSNVNDNICDFQGTIKVNEIRLYSQLHLGCDKIYADSNLVVQGVIITEYIFYEDPKDKHSAFFKGKIVSGWYKDSNNEIKYDDIRSYGDSWCNNLFYGEWTNYNNRQSKICNWGDGRIPNSGDLDNGTAEFYPNKKYLKNGWENYKYLYDTDESNRDKFYKLEQSKWW
jgi:hypothetical protein